MAQTLATLPNDILAFILNNPHSSYLVLTLWKCGSSQLNQRLVKSISEVTLVDTKVTSSSAFPKLLSELQHLRSLTIDRGNGFLDGTSPSLFAELSRLPRGLEKLDICSRDVPGACNETCDGKETPYDWSAILPELKHLTLDSYSYRRPYVNAKWPSKLETLSVPWCEYQDEKLVGLPRTLKSIEKRLCSIYDYRKEGHPRRPRQTICFDIVSEPKLLPPPLRHLAISNVQDDHPDEYKAEWINDLPLSLETLKLPSTIYFDSGAIKRLPRTLTALIDRPAITWSKLADHEGQHGLFNTHLLWPPMLTQLDCFGIKPSSEDLKFLPVTLTSLSLYIGESIDLQHLENLRRLTSLTLSGPGNGSCPVELTNWPSSLTSLHIELSESNPETDIWLRTHLPTSLQTLIYIVRDYDYEYDYPIPIMPAGLTYLEIDNCDDAWLSNPLPSTLRTLLIVSVCFSNPRRFSNLPSGLECLYFRYLLQDSGPFCFPRTCFSHLHHLHTLVISTDFGPQKLDLPPNLTRLQMLPEEDAVSFAAQLPPSLKYMDLTDLPSEQQQELAATLDLNIHFTLYEDEAIGTLHERLRQLNPKCLPYTALPTNQNEL